MDAGTVERGYWRSLAATLVCCYAPYAWLIVGDRPWSEYRWSWIQRWPILPGLLPSSLLVGQSSQAVLMLVMAVFTLATLSVLFYVGSRSKRALVICSLSALLLSMLHSWGVYQVYRA